MFDDSVTKKLIIEICEFRDEIGLKIKNDKSNAIMLVSPRGEEFRLSEAEIMTIKKIIDNDPKLQELASGLQTICVGLLGYFHFAVNY